MERLKDDGIAFCESVNARDSRAHEEAGALVREYLCGRIEPNQIVEEINKHSFSTPWGVQISFRGKEGKPTFSFEPDARGARDAWLELAQILCDGVSLNRMKICSHEECGKIFYDASPRGDKTTCSKRCKQTRDSRTSRIRHAQRRK